MRVMCADADKTPLNRAVQQLFVSLVRDGKLSPRIKNHFIFPGQIYNFLLSNTLRLGDPIFFYTERRNKLR